MKELLEYLAKALVDEPDQVMVEEFDDEGLLVFEVHVAEDDMGKVIGKEGRTVAALRTIVKTIARKNGDRATVEIVD